VQVIKTRAFQLFVMSQPLLTFIWLWCLP